MKTEDLKIYTVYGDGRVHETFEINNAHYNGFALGVEAEFFTVDEKTLTPTNYTSSIEKLPEFGNQITPEFPTALFEVSTLPHASLELLLGDLVRVTRQLNSTVQKQGGKLLPLSFIDVIPQENAGTCIQHDLELNMSERYQQLIDAFGQPLMDHSSRVASLQVNVGADDEEQAFRIFNGFRLYLPFLMAISAASPFREGRPNDIISNRLNAYDLGFTERPEFTGIPPELSNLEEYAAFVQSMSAFQDPGRIYNYVRPMPQRGVAAEIRCMDMQPTLEDCMAITALTKAMTYSILDSPPKISVPLDVVFLYSRIVGFDKEKKDTTLKTLKRFSTFLDENEKSYMEPLFERIENGIPAQKMVQQYRQQGLFETYRALANNFLN